MPSTKFSRIFVNTQHCPIGAFASFALGAKGPQGGLGLELGRPAEQSVFIGLESSGGPAEETFDLLPFCELPVTKIREGVDDFGRAHARSLRRYRFIPDRRIRRILTPATDTWEAGDLTFRIHSPVEPAPDPACATKTDMMLAYLPAVTVELHIDNKAGAKARRFFFGFREAGGPRAFRRIYDHPVKRRVRGVAYGAEAAIVTDAEGIYPATGFSVDEVLSMRDLATLEYGLGRVGLLVGEVAAGQVATFLFAVCFHRAGIATTGIPTRYLYTRFFPDLESVAAYAMKHFGRVHTRGSAFDERVAAAALTPERQFMLSQAVHSYYGSTELLEAEDGPWWIVNEGEYRMMNTLDLTVDQLPFELEFNPWTVRNTLDRALQRYSYTDKLRLPGDSAEYPGGLAFTHDMGVANHFSPPGHSAYEMAGTAGTFSPMTHEEVLNWTICALALAVQQSHREWGAGQRKTLAKLLESLARRDHPDPARRDGVMDADSSRCGGASEITSYDSLDPALRQSRRSLYLAVKSWAVYVGLADYFVRLGARREAAHSLEQADRAARSICAEARRDGTLPALLGADGATLVLPAVEGLILPYLLGLDQAMDKNGRWGHLIRSLARHFRTALKSGKCHFPDGGWKISSTSDNSWLSKIYLNGFLADEVLGVITAREQRRSDRVHAGWSADEQNAYWAWSDQILNGKAVGSKYYPRGITSFLWLKACCNPIIPNS